MIASRRVDPARLLERFDAIADELYRFPAIDPDLLRASVSALIAAPADRRPG